MRDLVSIERSNIDQNSIQAFVLASSDELIVLQYVYDFTLNGLMVLRTKDVTKVRCSATDKEFVIGRVIKTTLNSVQFQHFSGAANWAKSPANLKFNAVKGDAQHCAGPYFKR
jgi:hypothetical protein